MNGDAIPIHGAEGSLGKVTARQATVVAGIARGLSDSEIAEILRISPRTVRAHAEVAKLKVNAKRRAELPYAFFCATGLNPLTQVFP